MKPDIKYLLLDIGDVLLLKDRTRSFSELLAEQLNIDLNLASKVNELHYTTMETGYVAEDIFIKNLAYQLDYRAPKDIYKYFRAAYEKQVSTNQKMLSFLNEIRNLGIKTAVLSNTISIYHKVQEELGISSERGFSPQIYSWQTGLVKPSAEIFHLAIKEIGVQPDEILFIDDKISHIEMARKVSMNAILFRDTDETISLILKYIQ